MRSQTPQLSAIRRVDALAPGTPPSSWLQAHGGWTTAKLLLDVYGHFLPSEYTGYADALSQPPNAPYTHPEALVPADAPDDGAASPTSSTGFRLPAGGDDAKVSDHALHGAAALLEELGDVDGDGVDSEVADLVEESA